MIFDPPISVLGPIPAQSPLVFSFAHSGRKYPKSFVSQTRLPVRDLRRCEDAYVDKLFPATVLKEACFVMALFPRTWADANRHPQALDPEMFLEALPGHEQQLSAQVQAGFGVIPKLAAHGYPIYSHRLSREQAATRIEQAHAPYHKELTRRLSLAKQRFGFAVLVDCHSMPRAGRQMEPPHGVTEIVLGDRYGASCNLSLRNCLDTAFTKQGFSVSHNQPYAGGYSIRRYGRPRLNLHAIQIEIARDLYMDESTLKAHEHFSDIAGQMTQIMRELKKFVRQFARELKADETVSF